MPRTDMGKTQKVSNKKNITSKKEQSKPQGKYKDITSYFPKVQPAQSTNQVQRSASTAPHRGGGTTRIPEGIRATSYPNKKRRMQRYESDTEDEVGIFHGININNNINYNAINETTQRDMESPPPHSTNRGRGTNRILENISTHSNSKASQEDPLSGYSTPTPTQLTQEPDNEETINWVKDINWDEIDQIESSNSSQTNNRSLLQPPPPLPNNSSQNNNRSPQQPPHPLPANKVSRTQSNSAMQSQSGNSSSTNEAILTHDAIKRYYPKDYFNEAKPVEEGHRKNFLWNEEKDKLPYGANHATKFMVKFEAIAKGDVPLYKNNIKKRHLATFYPDATYVAKGSNYFNSGPSDNIVPCLREQANSESYPLLHSEAAGLENMTYSYKPHEEISEKSFLYQRIKQYKRELNKGEYLRIKITGANNMWPPCKGESKGEGIACTPLLKNFINTVSKKFNVEARMAVNSPYKVDRFGYEKPVK